MVMLAHARKQEGAGGATGLGSSVENKPQLSSSATCMRSAGSAPQRPDVRTSQKGDSAVPGAGELLLEAQWPEGGRFHCSWLPALRLFRSMTSVMLLATVSKRTRWSSCLWWPVTVAGLSK